MYTHAGNNRIIRTKEIIGIFDMDTATMSQATREYLRAAEKDGRMVNIKEEIPKSFIVTEKEDGRDTVWVSQISTSALLGRVKAGIGE
ncbi:MAG: DUF370 domain-containing protein [Oscillospiraceae bacterium]|nr:DUF370 domain-containing protein [Oscillospiraceae bacterium]